MSIIHRQHLLLSNQWVNWGETSQKASPEFLASFWDPCRILVFMATKRKKSFSNNFVEMVLGWPFIRFLQAIMIGKTTWPPGARAFLPYMATLYSGNLKHLLRKCKGDFQIIL